MTYLEKIKQMYALIGQGKMMDAFEKYYHQDVVMMEATGEVRKGKDTNRKFEQEWLSNVQEMHGGGVKSVTSNEEEGITMVEAWSDMTYGGQRMKMEEVAIQKWEGDQIIHERFYYNTPG
ncbi:MAG: nuclear transport factor 2 family protein [Candidatus Cyclobacteriaceae bacterium M3_2C_046]